MSNAKQLIVLSGSGRKGVVKLTASAGGYKGVCSLDFRPAGATLYIVDGEVAAVPLKDLSTSFEVPFLTLGEPSCLVRSSSFTMFGGPLSHSELLSKVNAHLNSSPKPAPSSAPHIPHDTSPIMPPPDIMPPADDAPAPLHPDPSPSSPASISSPHEPINDWTRFDGNNFYYAVKPQLDEMFVRYPQEQTLCLAVQNSKWVRIDAEDGAYCVGILYDGSEPAFVCYAVPEAHDNRRPPSEIADMCVWLPVASNSVVGYWMIYQSAKTGEIIK